MVDVAANRNAAEKTARDGRHRRRERSRARVVDAALELVRQSGRLPSARLVAARAGLTERTVFNLFEDRTAMMLAVVVAFRSEALQRIPPVPDACDLGEGIERFVAALSGFLDDYAKVRWAVATSRAAVPDVERGVVLTALRQRTRTLFERHGIDLDAQPDLTAAVHAAIDPLTWRLYREQQQLDLTASRRAVARTLLALAREASAQTR